MDNPKRKQAEKAREESEVRFKRMADNIRDGLSIIENRKIIYVNDRICEITGYSRKELIKLSSIEIAAPEEKDRVKKFMENVSNGLIPLKDFEYWIIRKDGSRRYIHNRYSCSQENNIIDRFIITTDITERKLAEQKLKESEARFRTLYENIAGGILIIGHDYIIKDVNIRTCQITGFNRDELIGQKCDIICPKGSQSKLCPIWEEGKEGLEGMDTTIRCKDGKLNPIIKNIKKISLEGKIYILENFQDIAECKITEEKLRESEIKHRLAYNKANFYKDLFAHDMSTVLHNILSSIELYTLCQKYPEKLEKGEDLLEIIRDQANRGAKLISNVNKLSKLEETELILQKLEMLPYLKEAFKFVENSFRGRNINVILDTQIEKIFVIANELILDVFENLLINSVKYNNNDSVVIIIKISKDSQDDIKYIKIQIIDNGIGIPDFRKETIFQRGINKDISIKGMGIGLSLVRSILSSFNGYISVEDKVPGDYTKGSNFIIYIPEAE